jgi:transcriptional regulator with XRE-family HTH domain
MNQVTEKDKANAFLRWWTTKFPVQDFDQTVVPFLQESIRPKVGWLRAAREGLMQSSGRAAEKAGISRTAWTRIERAELQGKVTIASLAQMAEALDCELVYAIRPKKRVRFSEVIWQQLLGGALSHGWVRHAPSNNKHGAIAKIATLQLENTAFRRKKAWSLRKPKPIKPK